MSDTADRAARAQLVELLDALTPVDEAERADRAAIDAWVRGGAPLWRVAKPAQPPMHLVAYCVVLDEDRGRLLLVDHRLAGLWLPPGGHVEPYEDPWATAARECREELGIEAVPATVSGRRPFFCTVTKTREAHPHTDVSLWYVLRAGVDEVVAYDRREFAGIRWLSARAVLDEPIETLDPAMHRFVRKLTRS